MLAARMTLAHRSVCSVMSFPKSINAGLADPKIKARLADLGGTPLAGSPIVRPHALVDRAR